MTFNTKMNLVDLYIRSITLCSLIRPSAFSNSYSAPAYWFAEQCPHQLSHSRAQLDWVRTGVPILLINGSGSKFEDNSNELFNRVTVKKSK